MLDRAERICMHARDRRHVLPVRDGETMRIESLASKCIIQLHYDTTLLLHSYRGTHSQCLWWRWTSAPPEDVLTEVMTPRRHERMKLSAGAVVILASSI